MLMLRRLVVPIGKVAGCALSATGLANQGGIRGNGHVRTLLVSDNVVGHCPVVAPALQERLDPAVVIS